uniref:Factor of DNA methylation 1-5/IDN2 domain-containing protein n=1 Tax=Populus trichocarpa TaxID=3694 RepID=A0A2K1ZCE9_POPTR
MHACLHGFSEDYEEKSTRICSLLQHDVTNPMWHPFKKEFVDGKFNARYVIPELWSLNDGRKASLQEAIKCIIIELKTCKSLERKR